jgi:hypothetical protein
VASRWLCYRSGVYVRRSNLQWSLPAKYQLIDPVIDGKQYRYIRANIIREGHESALYKIINKRIVDNPALVLEDTGVKVDDYCKNVELIVSPESLRTSGVALREFAII